MVANEVPRTILFASLAFGYIGYFVHPRWSCRRRLKSSEVFIKGSYTAECLLSDALSSKYQVSINSDSLLSSFSYQNSPYIASLLIGTRTPGQKKMVLFAAAYFVVAYLVFSLLSISGYAIGNISFLISAVASVSMLILVTIFLFIGIVTLKSSFEEEDAAYATVYLNTTEENWVASSDLALFNPAEKVQVAIKWSMELLLYGPYICGILLSSFLQVIFNEGEGHHRDGLSVITIIPIILSALGICCGVVFLVLAVRTIMRTVPTVEVQLAKAISKDDADNVDMLEFDVGKVIRKFANDIAKDFADDSGQKWTTSTGGYYDFAIAGEFGGLVYGRLKASGISVNA
ncbi:hypothetical protein V1517DRAFT_327405 [Lipomyces orientalis]|uniref:Uncharacterized protein n=1 Tax=Lipomyces orientalis TaxID=1233043 RepID=A0ACC3TLT5_9ASCO